MGAAAQAAAAALALALPLAADAGVVRLPAAPRGACLTSAGFDAPEPGLDGTLFRARVDVACPPGVRFTAALRSASGCRLRADGGMSTSYELFADPEREVPIVSCSRPAQTLSGAGRASFVLYGRIDRTAAAGRLTDTLLATVTR